MRASIIALLLVGLALPAGGPAVAQAITPESLQGATIVATVNLDIHARFDGQEYKGPTSDTYQLVIGAGGAYTGSITLTNARGATHTSQIRGTLGRAREARGTFSGHGVWFLSGNTITALRTFQQGGANVTITLGPGARSCIFRYKFMREVGAGSSIKRESFRGGSAEIFSARQTSSSCQITRG